MLKLLGEVVLVSVENKTKLHSFHIDGKITCLLWTQEKKADVNSSPNHEQEQIDYLKNVVCILLYYLHLLQHTFFLGLFINLPPRH